MNLDIRNRHDERIDSTFTFGGGDSDVVVVVGHGVTSHKERPWQTRLCDRLAEAGVDSVRITFAGNPGSDGEFADATPTKEVEDLISVIDALPSGRVVVYAGHSMGGAVGVMAAAREPGIRGLVSLAGMVHVHEFMQRVFGHLEFGQAMLDKPHCPWNEALVEDAQRIGSLTELAAQIEVPWLLVHGTADELVPYQDALDIHAAAGGRPELVSLDGVDHRFSEHEGVMADAVIDWVRRQF